MAALTSIAIAATAVGTGLSVYGQLQQASNAKALGQYNAKLAEEQAKQTEMDARETLRRKRQENKKFSSRQRGAYARAGVLNEGTPLEVMAETAGTLELQALDYAREQKQQAVNLRAQGAMDRAAGSMQARAAQIQAGASLLQGAGSVASMGASFNKTGA